METTKAGRPYLMREVEAGRLQVVRFGVISDREMKVRRDALSVAGDRWWLVIADNANDARRVIENPVMFADFILDSHEARATQ